ncbi:hypothetical protein [Phenylobacterium sp.]|jgi:hypothetical protein|uniref:hypothetical protein n=1 Tax=Phenylobacterium sp. TaxID=1871053 RepID=UPI002F3E7CD3
MGDDIEPTPEERRAIRALKRLAKSWPKSIWLFAGSGDLHIMRAGPDGEHIHGGGGGHEAVDPAYLLDSVSIPNDGGDW